MSIRMSGMVSGLDTESIVTELVKAQQSKLDKIKDKQTTLDWKSDKWTEVNKQISDFYTGKLSDMRLKSSYNTKKASVTDSAVASATAESGAVKGNHVLKVERLASAASFTSKELTASGSDVTSKTKLTDINEFGFKTGSIKIFGHKDGKEEIRTFTIDDNTTLGDFVDSLKKAGLNANFDTTQKRLYVSSNGEGVKNNFDIQNVSGNEDFVNNVFKPDKKAATDALFSLDGVTYNTSGNENTINGIKLNLTGTTGLLTDDKSTTVVIKNDTDEVYKKIVDFVAEYNKLVESLNNLYSADDASDYKPLTDDQKETMTDDEINKWNEKIQGALLRNDSYLGDVVSALRNSFYGVHSLDSDGKATSEYASLSLYGIHTSSDWKEKGKLYIDGDKDSSLTSGNENLLKKALESDPDKVAEDLSTIFGNLYDNLKKIANTSNDYKSSQKFYNDKEITKQKAQYKTDYSDMEKELNELSDRYYKQFSKMEVTLQKIQESASSFTSMTGQ